MPDIDLDFPRDIREKLIVAVTERYGREHAALVATFSTYRSRGAIRDVGKALGLPVRRARAARARHRRLARDRRRRTSSTACPGSHTGPRWQAFRELTHEIAGLPRHLSQHPGGMVISTRPLIDLVPVQPAAMAGRQICQWDKDSCADAGFLKIDLLGLGMLSAVEEAVDLIARLHGEPIDLSRIPLDDPEVYARDPGRRHRRALPDREPRPDAEPAAHPAREPRRPDRPGRARPAGADPGQGRPPVHRAPPAAARRPRLRLPGRARVAPRAAPGDARRRRLPGSGARRRDGGRAVQRGGGRRACAAR